METQCLRDQLAQAQMAADAVVSRQVIQGTFRERAGNMQGTFRERSGNVQGTCRERSGMVVVAVVDSVMAVVVELVVAGIVVGTLLTFSAAVSRQAGEIAELRQKVSMTTALTVRGEGGGGYAAETSSAQYLKAQCQRLQVYILVYIYDSVLEGCTDYLQVYIYDHVLEGRTDYPCLPPSQMISIPLPWPHQEEQSLHIPS
jgi:hypothetical protein